MNGVEESVDWAIAFAGNLKYRLLMADGSAELNVGVIFSMSNVLKSCVLQGCMGRAYWM